MSTRSYMGADCPLWDKLDQAQIQILKTNHATVLKSHIWFEDWVNNANYRVKMQAVATWLKANNIKHMLQFQGWVWNEDYGTCKRNVVMNAGGYQDQWIAWGSSIIAALQPEMVGLLNEPEGNYSWTDYKAAMVRIVAALKAVKSDLVFVVDANPFWDFYPLSQDPVPGSITQIHNHYAKDGPAVEDWELAYMRGDLANAKAYLNRHIIQDYGVHYCLEKHIPIMMGEIGSNILNPNCVQYTLDMGEIAKQNGMGFLQHEFRGWDPSLGYYNAGILNASWDALNETLGMAWSQIMLGEYVPPVEPPPAVTYPCPYCTLEFATESALAAHITAVHFPVVPPPITLYACPTCGEVFATQESLDAHIAANHGPATPPVVPSTTCMVAFLTMSMGLSTRYLWVVRQFRDRILPGALIKLYYQASKWILGGIHYQ